MKKPTKSGQKFRLKQYFNMKVIYIYISQKRLGWIPICLKKNELYTVYLCVIPSNFSTANGLEVHQGKLLLIILIVFLSLEIPQNSGETSKNSSKFLKS